MTIHEALELGGRIGNPVDALMVGLQVTAIGLLIVFSVLIILMFVLKGMQLIFAPKDEKGQKAHGIEISQNYTETKSSNAVMPPQEDEEELIAVLTAAIAASLNTSTYNLKIKSFKRVAGRAPAWNKAGLNDTINSRF